MRKARRRISGLNGAPCLTSDAMCGYSNEDEFAIYPDCDDGHE